MIKTIFIIVFFSMASVLFLLDERKKHMGGSPGGLVEKLYSIAGAAVLLFCDAIFNHWILLFDSVFSDILFAASAILFSSGAGEKSRRSVPFLSCLLAVGLSLSPFQMKGRIFPAAVLTALLVDMVLRIRKRFVSATSLFSNVEIIRSIEELSVLYYAIALCLGYSLELAAYGVQEVYADILRGLSSSVILAVYFLSFVRLSKGGTGFLRHEEEEKLKRILKGTLRVNDCDKLEDSGMARVYNRMKIYMEEKKPYLDENITLEDFSKKVYTNKTYCSKAINVMSGRNFSQFMNYYRIEYSLKLLEKDPHLKIEELALMSGFHTVVSYNMAFKLFKGMTPSEWIRENIR